MVMLGVAAVDRAVETFPHRVRALSRAGAVVCCNANGDKAPSVEAADMADTPRVLPRPPAVTFRDHGPAAGRRRLRVTVFIQNRDVTDTPPLFS